MSRRAELSAAIARAEAAEAEVRELTRIAEQATERGMELEDEVADARAERDLALQARDNWRKANDEKLEQLTAKDEALTNLMHSLAQAGIMWAAEEAHAALSPSPPEQPPFRPTHGTNLSNTGENQ